MTSKEVAELTGLSLKTVNLWASKNNVEKKPIKVVYGFDWSDADIERLNNRNKTLGWVKGKKRGGKMTYVEINPEDTDWVGTYEFLWVENGEKLSAILDNSDAKDKYKYLFDNLSDDDFMELTVKKLQ